jgi:hypothetical protein
LNLHFELRHYLLLHYLFHLLSVPCKSLEILD